MQRVRKDRLPAGGSSMIMSPWRCAVSGFSHAAASFVARAERAERIPMTTLPMPRGAALLLFTAVVWGAMFAVAKSTLASLDAFWVSALRYVPAALLMLAILRVVEGRRALSADGARLKLWLFGSLGFAGFSILGFLGLARSRPEHAAIIVSLMPLVTALVDWLVRGRRPAPATLAATMVALAGVALVITKGHWHLIAQGTAGADMLVLAGVVCWVAYTMGASTLPGYSALRYTAHSMAYGALTICVITLLASAAGLAHPPAWGSVASVVGEIVYLSLVGGVLAVLAWNRGVALLGPLNGVLFINLVPITAFAIGIAQGHRLGAVEIAGATLTIGALLVNNAVARGWRDRSVAGKPRYA
jgi:drug/metabolite transporter (DMT)-like permease